jgi:hypothetical protein
MSKHSLKTQNNNIKIFIAVKNSNLINVWKMVFSLYHVHYGYLSHEPYLIYVYTCSQCF